MKKILISVMALAVVFIFVACADSATNTQQEGTTVAVTDSTTKPEVSIPTDSGIADSVFDDVSVPTDAVNGDSTDATGSTTAAVEEDDTTEEGKPATEATAPDTKPEDMTYEAFIALAPAEQRLYQESFSDLDAFFAWYNAAKEKYEKENPPIDIDGPVDLGKL